MERNMYIIISSDNYYLAEVFANTMEEAAKKFFNTYEAAKRKRYVKIEKMYWILNQRTFLPEICGYAYRKDYVK